MNLFANHDGKNLSDTWQWINQPDEWRFNDAHELEVTAPPLADFFLDPAGQHVRSSAPFLYTRVDGNFTVSTQVEAEMIDDYDSACLMVMVDDNHWAKVCFENSYKKPTIVSVVTKGTSDDCNSQSLAVNRPYLRLTRNHDCFAFHYSLDGTFWYLVRYFAMEAPQQVKVGVVAQSPVGRGCKTRFIGFNYTDRPVTNLRSGE